MDSFATAEVFPFFGLLLFTVAYCTWLVVSYKRFCQERSQLKYRVHVNGIRGKSTVTRYVAAVFRAAGYRTFAKTTGSAAQIIGPDGEESSVQRRGNPNVNEQARLIRQFCRQGAEVIVMECMAINPTYAEWLEHQVMRSHLGIITNIRYDHPDYLGETLPEIAHSLGVTIPKQGTLITTESNSELLAILQNQAEELGTQVISPDSRQITQQDLAQFSHVAIPENISIGLQVADYLGISHSKALAAMQSAAQDVGALTIQQCTYQSCRMVWANLFAVNDRESFQQLCGQLFQEYRDLTKVIILNNRSDRPLRVELFATLAKNSQADAIVTLGCFENPIAQLLEGSHQTLIHCGDSTPFKEAKISKILEHLIVNLQCKEMLLVGAVNIHTDQAQRLIDWFSNPQSEAIEQTEEKPKEKLILRQSYST